MILEMLLIATAMAPDPDPLAPAARGEMQCYAPDVARKTCRALAGYDRQADGSYLNRARVLIDPKSDLAMETVVTVHVVDGAVCGTIAQVDVLAGTLYRGGKLQPDAEAAPYLRNIADAESAAGMTGKMICTRYVADGTMLKALVSVDGAYVAGYDDSVLWVRPDQGYRVAP